MKRKERKRERERGEDKKLGLIYMKKTLTLLAGEKKL
jgi:hypothetical protein